MQKASEKGISVVDVSSSSIAADDGDTVSFSEESKKLADMSPSLEPVQSGTVERLTADEVYAKTEGLPGWKHSPGQRTLSATSKQGTTVTVTHVASHAGQSETAGPAPTEDTYYMNINRKDGSRISYSFTGNTRINENEDGSMSIYFSAINKTHLYDHSGNITEVDGDILAGDNSGDDIFINTTGLLVDAGDGDDIIISWADNASIIGGSGDDTVILGENVQRNTVDMGYGNDTVIAHDGVTDTDISLGEGNNAVFIDTLTGGSLTAGNGNNYIGKNESEGMHVRMGASIAVGDGDNTFQLGSIVHGASVSAGNGDNTLSFYSVHDDVSITFGNGNNKIDGYGLYNNSNISLGTVWAMGAMLLIFMKRVTLRLCLDHSNRYFPFMRKGSKIDLPLLWAMETTASIYMRLTLILL